MGQLKDVRYHFTLLLIFILRQIILRGSLCDPNEHENAHLQAHAFMWMDVSMNNEHSIS